MLVELNTPLAILSMTISFSSGATTSSNSASLEARRSVQPEPLVAGAAVAAVAGQRRDAGMDDFQLPGAECRLQPGDVGQRGLREMFEIVVLGFGRHVRFELSALANTPWPRAASRYCMSMHSSAVLWCSSEHCTASVWVMKRR